MTQKVLKVGSSAAVISKKAKQKNSDKEIIKWTNDFIKRYRKGLEALAKK